MHSIHERLSSTTLSIFRTRVHTPAKIMEQAVGIHPLLWCICSTLELGHLIGSFRMCGQNFIHITCSRKGESHWSECDSLVIWESATLHYSQQLLRKSGRKRSAPWRTTLDWSGYAKVHLLGEKVSNFELETWRCM